MKCKICKEPTRKRVGSSSYRITCSEECRKKLLHKNLEKHPWKTQSAIRGDYPVDWAQVDDWGGR